MKNQYIRPITRTINYMATNYDAAVNSFYLAYYGRPADPAGLAYWSQALAQNNGDFSAIVAAFSTSTEATDRFGSATPADRIADVYQQLFNRAPDQAGLDYWTKAIATGTVSIADAAIQIMNGAQDTDAQLSTLRQEAAAQFTAEVAASGVPYDGSAAIDAARVLIAAVTPTTSATDIASLVTATKSLVQTAHDNPAVIAALAGSGSLTSLLTSSSGKADPVAMVEALASVGKAAATDTTALTTLKQGGGMAGLVDSLPAGTSLNDVTHAADQGGLTAVGGLATPPAPADTTPPAAPTVQLVADTGTSATDNLTNNGQIKISGLEAGSTWQYSFDGKLWHVGPTASNTGIALLNTSAEGEQTLQVRSTDSAGNTGAATTLHYTLKTSFAPTLAFQGTDGNDLTTTKVLTNTDNYWVNLHGAKGAAAVGFQVSATGVDGTWTDAKDSDPLADGTHFIRYVVTDAAGNTAPTNALEVDMDKTAPAAPTVALAADTGASSADLITYNTNVKVSGLEAGATWEYSKDNGTHWTTGAAIDNQGVAYLSDNLGGAQTVLVRSTDAAGNLSATTTFSYTVEKAPLVTLNVAGKFGWDVSTNNKGLSFQLDLHGHANDVTTTYQVSTTGNAADFQTWDTSSSLADGTYYFRAVGVDVAGNAYTTNNVVVHLDNTVPATPTGVQLQEDTGVKGDLITMNGAFVVSGLEKGALWQFSSDGTTWFQGAPAADDGTATGFDQVQGEQTLQVRTYDNAGNTSAPVSLHFTLDSHNPADGLKLDHIGPNGVQGDAHTTLPTPDVVFSYTGAIEAGDTLEYTLDYTFDNAGNDVSVWTKIDSTMIDAAAKTVTFHNFDLSSADAYITIRGADLAGAHPYYQQQLDGPVTSYFTQYAAGAPKFILSGQYTADLYLTDGGNAPVKLPTLDASGGLVGDGSWIAVGPQATAMQGVLGAGNDATVLTVKDTGTYAFGTTGADTLSGNYVWGFGGDDTITATGTTAYNSAVISGGTGADTIHTETSSSQLLYQGSQDSFLANDGASAHGFDTVYLSAGAVAPFTDSLILEGLALGDYYTVAGGSLDGSETGSALLARMNTAVTGSFKTGLTTAQVALIDFGTDGGGHAVSFLAVDADKDGHITDADYVIKIVGAIDSSGVYTSNGNGGIVLNTHAI
jgi:hypothetical protein